MGAPRHALLLLAAGCRFHGGLSHVDASGEVDAADAPIDVAPDAFDPLCFGPEPFTVCLAALPTAPVVVGGGGNVITDISSANKCDSDKGSVLLMNGQQVCVVAGTTITANNPTGSYGALPLVLVATDTITINGLFDARSVLGAQPGPGDNPAACGDLTASDGANKVAGAGGGAGGSFAGAGGAGGRGAAGLAAAGAPIASVVPPQSVLRGGCPGGHGGLGSNGNAVGGAGGGAIYMVARNAIALVTATLTVGGAGGAGGKSRGGGGGGGSGGMIVLDAPMITLDPTSFLHANGGGGGAGGGMTVDGGDGANATAVNAAASGGGVGDLSATGGGAGGFQAIGAGSSTQATVGGGGGGGGVGVIRVLSGQPLPATNVSPPPN